MPETLNDIELLRRLVAFDSTSGRSNLPIADFVCDYLRRPGLRVERFPSADGAFVNLLAWAGPDARAGEGLLLSGHVDTVPANEPEWRSDPLSLIETDDSLVARGACDMKGFDALALNALASADLGALRRPLALLLTYEEEVGSLGAERFAQTFPAERPLPRSVLVGEPTSLRVVRMHKGHFKMRITIRGRSAHSGYPHLGRNAIEPAGPIIQALTELRKTLERERVATSDFFPRTPFVTLNIGRLRAGEAVNVVPDRCELSLGLRPLPGMSARDIAERVRAVVLDAACPAAGDCAVEFYHDNPPMLLDENAGTHAAIREIVGQHGSCAVSYASDAGHLSRRGHECVLFGPGSIENAHKPNEFVPKSEFAGAAPLLQKIIRRFCIDPERS